MNVAQAFGLNRNRTTHEPSPHVVGVAGCGVEIELENVTNRDLRSPYWEVKNDGSLRNNGVEFVNNGPQGGANLFNACVDLDSFLQDKNPDGNWRCSTHVHVDVRDMTTPELKRFILGYIVYEKLLFRLSGMHRYANNFCFAVGFAQQQLEHLSNCWRHEDDQFMSTTVSAWDKYSAMNLLPMARFGSVEFRSSAAEWRRGRLLRLCNRFLSLRELAKSWEGSELDLVNYLGTASPRDVMGKGLPKVMPEEWEEDIAIGLKLAHDILFVASLPEERPARISMDELLGRPVTARMARPATPRPFVSGNRVMHLLQRHGASYNVYAHCPGEIEFHIMNTSYASMAEQLRQANVHISNRPQDSRINARKVVVTAGFIEAYYERVSREVGPLIGAANARAWVNWKNEVTETIDNFDPHLHSDIATWAPVRDDDGEDDDFSDEEA